MNPITTSLPASMTDADFAAAVADMQEQLTAAGLTAEQQEIDLSQTDSGWLLTGSETAAWWL